MRKGQFLKVSLPFLSRTKFESVALNRNRDIMFKAWEKKAQTDEKAKFLVNKYQYRPQEELYDVNKDPYCMNNLIEDKELSSKRKELSAELKKWMDNCGDLGNETELNATNRISKVRVKKIQKEWLQLDGKIYN